MPLLYVIVLTHYRIYKASEKRNKSTEENKEQYADLTVGNNPVATMYLQNVTMDESVVSQHPQQMRFGPTDAINKSYADTSQMKMRTQPRNYQLSKADVERFGMSPDNNSHA